MIIIIIFLTYKNCYLTVKRKLLDSRMVPYYSEKWTEWNIRNAVKAWHRNPARSYGISVEVEDEDGNLLPVTRFFRPMNCSGDAQTRNDLFILQL